MKYEGLLAFIDEAIKAMHDRNCTVCISPKSVIVYDHHGINIGELLMDDEHDWIAALGGATFLAKQQ